MAKRIGVMTCGGDSPGENAAIKWIVKHALEENAGEVIGIKYGWKGLANGDYVPLDEQVVRTWDGDGGSNLGSSRFNPFSKDNRGSLDKTLSHIEQDRFDAIVAIGGDGTMKGAHALHRMKIPVVGIPQTIDKDVHGTEYTIGFSSALNEAKNFARKIRNTARSHDTSHIIEVMGGSVAGHLAFQTGIASSAAVILIPEYVFSLEKVIARLKHRRNTGSKYDIVVVSEGAYYRGSSRVYGDDGRLGGIGAHLAKILAQETHVPFRNNVPGHTLRGADPDAYDVEMGRYFGIAAVDLIKRKKFGYMVARRNGKVASTPLWNAIRGNYVLDPDRVYDKEKLTAKRTTEIQP